ncbi:MAG: HlyD family efflux transporter periplasmic adaptor subunit [Alphaproteobacteria bacterium]|nr:HlyD family efflux transporter periplasmic adaptor subunit [Alphaproteobacteria bacterium]MCB9928998.1 HlyD family efflux transporter periplasmic adaptor subunit [Alphaproteobacteria bacterium]
MDRTSGPEAVDATAEQNATVSVEVLDQTLWNRFRSAHDVEAFLQAWLALQCRQLGRSVSGHVVIGEAPDLGPFHPIAAWPHEDRPDGDIVSAANQALDHRRGVVLGETGTQRILAQPLLVLQQLMGAVVVRLGPNDLATPAAFRVLEWGAGWIEVAVRREQEIKGGELRERIAVAFDMLASVLEHARFDEACNALVADIARRMECETVFIGFAQRRHIRVRAMSQSSTFGARTNLMRDVSSAMDEAADQHAVILWPPPPNWEFRVTRAHEELFQAHGMGAILTVPMQNAGEIVGALTFERPRDAPFSPLDVDVLDAVASIVGPVLMDRKANDRLLIVKVWESAGGQLRRLLGPSHFATKLATLAVAAVVAFFAYTKTDYAVSSRASIEGTVQRTVVAPFNGYLAAQYASAGDVVQAEDILAALDDKDMALERLRIVTERQQKTNELDRSLAERKMAEVNIIRAQIRQSDAQLALIEQQLARTRVRAPFDGYVVQGDLSQRLGASIERGETLFRIAPLDSFRVILEVDERDIKDIAVGQEGVLRVSAIPETPLQYTVKRITPLAEQRDGRNWFRVEAALLTEAPDLRPGMLGIARTAIDERLLIRALSDRLVGWVRLALWRWLP